MARKAEELLTKIRQREHRRQNRGKSIPEYHKGDRVLVHHSKFPRWQHNDLHLPYFEPYPVTEVGRNTVKVKASPSMGGFLDVGYNQIKRYALKMKTWKHGSRWHWRHKSPRRRLMRMSKRAV